MAESKALAEKRQDIDTLGPASVVKERHAKLHSQGLTDSAK